MDLNQPNQPPQLIPTIPPSANHKKWFIAGISVLIVGGGVFAYTKYMSNSNINLNKSAEENSQIQKNLSKDNTSTSEVMFNNVVDANNQFASDLYSKYKSREENIFFSPYSVSSALAMTYEGAKGKTAEEMQAVLHLPNDKEKIRSGFLGVNNDLNQADKSYKLTIANALWAQKEYPFVADYFNIVDKYYGGKITNLDFEASTEKSRVTINNWVEDKTNNKIKDLIPAGMLTSATRLVLTNAIYFKADWLSKFDEGDTSNGQFKLSSGEEVDTKMMYKKSIFNYGENKDLQILEMDYLGNDLSMLIMLPKENNIGEVENIFSKEKLSEWKNGMKSEKVIVYLPKFKFGTKYFMVEDLKGMGMPTAFNHPNADFTGMSATKELYIGEVIHQTFIEVAEYGTEATAATVELMPMGAMMQPTEKEQSKIFRADHPFMFIIQQKNSGNILFMGRISNLNN